MRVKHGERRGSDVDSETSWVPLELQHVKQHVKYND